MDQVWQSAPRVGALTGSATQVAGGGRLSPRAESARCQRERLASAAILVGRFRFGSVRQFAHELGILINGRPLSRQAIYEWEAGKARVPAVALLAAAELVGLQLDDLLAAATRFISQS